MHIICNKYNKPNSYNSYKPLKTLLYCNNPTTILLYCNILAKMLISLLKSNGYTLAEHSYVIYPC